MSSLDQMVHKDLLQLARSHKIKGSSKMGREALIAAITDAMEFAELSMSDVEAGEALRAIELEKALAESETWVPKNPDLGEELTPEFRSKILESFDERADKIRSRVSKKPSGKTREEKVYFLDKNQNLEDACKHIGYMTKQLLQCARAVDHLNDVDDPEITVAAIATKALELGLETRQPAERIVKYYLGKLLDAGLQVR